MIIQLAQQKLEQIVRLPLLRHVGAGVDETVVQVCDWKAAWISAKSLDWENCGLSARNALQEKLEQSASKQLQYWNAAADAIRPGIVEFVARCAAMVPSKFAKEISDQIAWDVMFMCLEEAFKSEVPPLFYVRILEPWYARGHFPCGWQGALFPDDWDGELPAGRLVVY